MKEAVSICRPSTDDWKQIPHLLKTANFHHIGGPEMYRFLPENCYIAKIKDIVVGVAGYEILNETTAKTTLSVVSPEFRGQGIGTALKYHYHQYLYETGIRTISSNCDDERAIEWNCKVFGYKKTGIKIQKKENYGRTDKAYWINLKLELKPTSR